MYNESPLCLSIRQPWAWLIVNGHKDIENRQWPTKFRGRFLVHASKTMTFADYEDCLYFVSKISRDLLLRFPAFKSPLLLRGGIVGEATLTDCVTSHTSPWFGGEYGFVLTNRKPVEFTRCDGRLGFFPFPIIP